MPLCPTSTAHLGKGAGSKSCTFPSSEHMKYTDKISVWFLHSTANPHCSPLLYMDILHRIIHLSGGFREKKGPGDHRNWELKELGLLLTGDFQLLHPFHDPKESSAVLSCIQNDFNQNYKHAWRFFHLLSFPHPKLL